MNLKDEKILRTIGLYTNLYKYENDIEFTNEIDFKKYYLDKCWDKLKNSINYDSNNYKKYDIIGLKNFFKKDEGYIKIKKNKKSNCRSPGFSYAIHIKVYIKDNKIINIMFFIGNGVCNITGFIEYDDIIEVMKNILNILNIDKTIYFFIKIHMDKHTLALNNQIPYHNLKRLLNEDNSNYKITKTGNIATIQISCYYASELLNLYIYKDNKLTTLYDYSLIDINKLLNISSIKLKKELNDLSKSKDINYSCRIIIELNKNKIIFCSKRSIITQSIIDDFNDFLSFHKDEIYN